MGFWFIASMVCVRVSFNPDLFQGLFPVTFYRIILGSSSWSILLGLFSLHKHQFAFLFIIPNIHHMVIGLIN